MKARPFLASVLVAALLLITLGVGGWWLLLRQSPLSLQQQSLRIPLAARFVPRNAPLSLHLLVNPDRLSAYARAVASPGRRREAVEALERLRDGAFASAGLDYASELAGWLGAETSLAVIAPEGPAGPTGWLLALRSRDREGARRFLQRFWQTRALAGTELQISSYRGMGLISGRGALAGQSSRPLATALINDELVLIASGRGVLEQALDVSQIDELNQAASPDFAADLRRLERGVGLVTARPDAFHDWLGLPEAIAADATVSQLTAALSPEAAALRLGALLEVREPLQAPSLAEAPDLLAALRTDPESLALIQNPAALLQPPEDPADGTHPSAWNRLLGPLLHQAVGQLDGPLPALVSAHDSGPLLWARQKQGWLLATPAGSPTPEQLQPVLASEGLIAAPLSRSGQELQVWTRLESRAVKGDPDQLLASVAGARFDQNGVAWWGEGLGALNGQLGGRSTPRRRLDQLTALKSNEAPLQWALDVIPARELLAGWQPWRLLTGLAGTPLGATVQGLALSLEADPPPAVATSRAATAPRATGPGDTTTTSPALRLRARLQLG